MKKLLGTLVAVGAMALMAVGVQAATYSASTDVTPVEGVASVDVLVAPDEGTNTVNGYVMTLTYDSNMVNPVAAAENDLLNEPCFATVGTSFANGVLVSDDVTADDSSTMKTLAVAWAGAEAIDVNEQMAMANVQFKVVEGATGTANIDVAVMELTNDGNSLADTDTLTVNEGTIVIDTDFVLGDVTGNGDVNMDDVTLLTQFVNEVYDRATISDAYPKSNIDAGNVSGKDQETINMDDVTVLTQYINEVISSLEDVK